MSFCLFKFFIPVGKQSTNSQTYIGDHMGANLLPTLKLKLVNLSREEKGNVYNTTELKQFDFRNMQRICKYLNCKVEDPLWYILHPAAKSSFGPCTSKNLEEMYNAGMLDGQSELRFIDIYSTKNKQPFTFFKLKELEDVKFLEEIEISSLVKNAVFIEHNGVILEETYSSNNHSNNKRHKNSSNSNTNKNNHNKAEKHHKEHREFKDNKDANKEYNKAQNSPTKEKNLEVKEIEIKTNEHAANIISNPTASNAPVATDTPSNISADTVFNNTMAAEASNGQNENKVTAKKGLNALFEKEIKNYDNKKPQNNKKSIF